MSDLLTYLVAALAFLASAWLGGGVFKKQQRRRRRREARGERIDIMGMPRDL